MRAFWRPAWWLGYLGCALLLLLALLLLWTRLTPGRVPSPIVAPSSPAAFAPAASTPFVLSGPQRRTQRVSAPHVWGEWVVWTEAESDLDANPTFVARHLSTGVVQILGHAPLFGSADVAGGQVAVLQVDPRATSPGHLGPLRLARFDLRQHTWQTACSSLPLTSAQSLTPRVAETQAIWIIAGVLWGCDLQTGRVEALADPLAEVLATAVADDRVVFVERYPGFVAVRMLQPSSGARQTLALQPSVDQIQLETDGHLVAWRSTPSAPGAARPWLSVVDLASGVLDRRSLPPGAGSGGLAVRDGWVV